jgi:hypothetical protein
MHIEKMRRLCMTQYITSDKHASKSLTFSFMIFFKNMFIMNYNKIVNAF